MIFFFFFFLLLLVRELADLYLVLEHKVILPSIARGGGPFLDSVAGGGEERRKLQIHRAIWCLVSHQSLP